MDQARITTATLERPTARRDWYYGWVVLGVAALAMVGTLPGRTQGLGLITEPLLKDIGIDRVEFAQINLFATLVGSLFCFGIGGLVDRRGSRSVLTGIALLLGLVVIAMSAVSNALAILLLITLTRGLGQSALSVVSLAMPGKWFRRRLTLAMAVYAILLSIGFMIAFPIVGALVSARGWRIAWAAVGLSIACGLAAVAWFFVTPEPETNAELDASSSDEHTAASNATLGEALRTPAFWVFGIASAMYGLIASGIGLFNESILAERGFSADIYYRALAVTAITGLAGNFGAGAWARGSLRGVLLAALLLLMAALAALPHVTTTTGVYAQAVAMGVAGGFVTVVFFSFWGRAYGRLHLGRISGVAQALTVVASATGPLVFAWIAQSTGSYALAFYGLSAVMVVLAAAASIVHLPAGV
jgi:cyanate permease